MKETETDIEHYCTESMWSDNEEKGRLSMIDIPHHRDEKTLLNLTRGMMFENNRDGSSNSTNFMIHES